MLKSEITSVSVVKSQVRDIFNWTCPVCGATMEDAANVGADEKLVECYACGSICLVKLRWVEEEQ